MAAMFFNGSKRNEQFLYRTFHRCFLSSFGSFFQTLSERKNFNNQPIRNKNRMWRPCLFTNWDWMSIIYREPSRDPSYQVSVHLAAGFQRRKLKCEKLTDDRWRTPSDGKSSYCLAESQWDDPVSDQPKNKNCPWRPCLFMDQDKSL